MALYALTQFANTIRRTTDNAFIPNDPANRDWQDYQTWRATPGNVPDPLPVVPPSHVVAAIDYINRFSAIELANIQNFSLTNPPTAQSNAVYNYLYKLPLINTIDLTDANTVARHAFLVTQGLLTSARSTTILTP